METIAVYWEPVIRVYGFETRQGLAFFELEFPMTETAQYGQILCEAGSAGIPFSFCLIQHTQTHERLRMQMALDAAHTESLNRVIQRSTQHIASVDLRTYSPIDILFFYGPHFQDRYGIADKAFAALDKRDVPLHAAGCCGTTVYLVTADGQASYLKELLSDSFTVPVNVTTKNT